MGGGAGGAVNQSKSLSKRNKNPPAGDAESDSGGAFLPLVQVWSCGGSMEVVPCSRVAHLSRHHLPYQFPDQELLQRNKIRVADTWMEAYRKIFYRRDTLAHFIRQVRMNLHGP